MLYNIENKSLWRRADAAFIISPGINFVYYKKLFFFFFKQAKTTYLVSLGCRRGGFI